MALEILSGLDFSWVKTIGIVLVQILLPGLVLIGGAFWWRWYNSFNYDVEILYIGSRNIIRDKGRIVREKDGNTLFQLRKFKKVTMPMPRYEIALWYKGKPHVKLMRYSELDFANVEFMPADRVEKLHLDENGHIKEVFKVTSVNMRNWFVNQHRRSREKYLNGFLAKYGSIIIPIVLIVLVIIVVYMTFSYASDQVNKITSLGDHVASGLQAAGDMCKNIGNTKTPSPI